MAEWQPLYDAAKSKWDEVDCSAGLGLAMSVKDDEELVCLLWLLRDGFHRVSTALSCSTF
jgi:nucleosome binding factor SPN SPT16 subunit